MTNKIKIEMPEKVGCATHDAYIDICQACNLINKERLDAAKKKASDIAYVIVYKKWKGYLEAVRKPFKEDASNIDKNMIESDFVRDAKQNITRDLYPFTSDSGRFCRAIWNATIKDLSRLLWGFCPTIKVDVGKKRKKRITLWY